VKTRILKKETKDPGRPGNETPTKGGDTVGAPQNPKPSTTASEDNVIIAKDVLSSILSSSNNPEKELSTLVNLPNKALDIWALEYRESLDKNGHEKASRLSWASVRESYKRSRGKWIKR